MLREIKSGVFTFDKNDDLASIGDSLRHMSESLTLILPNGLETIPPSLCTDLKNLRAIAIPPSVSVIIYKAFEGCFDLEKVYIKDLTAWCNIDFSGINPLFYAHYLYKDGQEIKDLEIPQGVTEIKKYAFHGCTSLTSVTIPKSVTSIGEGALKDCTGLTSVTIGNGVTSIKDDAFYSCTSLKSITIPESVTYIGEAAFCLCRGLKSITIGSNVTSIREYAFAVCDNLREAIFENPNGWSFDVSDPKQAARVLRTSKSDLIRQ